MWEINIYLLNKIEYYMYISLKYLVPLIIVYIFYIYFINNSYQMSIFSINYFFFKIKY